MAVKASNSITLSSVVDVKAVYRYYLLQSSTLAKPSKPTTNPPSSSWDDTEPTYTEGSTNSLYIVDLTVFSDDTWSYSEVSLSSSYEAAKTAYNKAVNAQSTANSAKNAVDNLEIGGRNFVVGSADHGYSPSFNSFANTVLGVADFTITNEKFNGLIIARWNGSSTVNYTGPYFYSKNILSTDLVIGEIYTISAWMKADAATSIRSSLASGQTVQTGSYTVGTTWTRVWVTFKASGTDGNFCFYTEPKATTSAPYIYMCGLKLEFGNKVTDWSPAPEDGAETGGRNLITGTSDEWTNYTHGTWSAPIKNILVADLVSKYGMKNGDPLVYSAYIKSNGGKTLAAYVSYVTGGTTISSSGYGASIDSSTEGWSTVKFKLDTSAEYVSLRIYNRTYSTVTGNTTESYKLMKLEAGYTQTTWTPAPEDVDNAIIDSADQVRVELAEQDAQILKDANSVTMTALEGYVKSTEYDAWKETVDAELAVLPGEISGQVSTLTERINAVDDDLQEKFNQITKYFTFNINGLTIGQVDSPYKIVIDNDRYGMYVNDVEVLWMDIETREVHTPEITIIDKLRMLGYKAENGANGNLNWDYMGGE